MKRAFSELGCIWLQLCWLCAGAYSRRLGHSTCTLYCHVSLVTCLLLTLLPRERENIPALGLSLFLFIVIFVSSCMR